MVALTALDSGHHQNQLLQNSPGGAQDPYLLSAAEAGGSKHPHSGSPARHGNQNLKS